MVTAEPKCPPQESAQGGEAPSSSSVMPDWFWRQARKIVVLVVGTTVMLIGLAGLLLPVLPGWALIFVGLFILGTEFAWARWMLKVAKQRAGKLVDAAKTQVYGKTTEDRSSP